MILLEPSQAIQREIDLDFDVLGEAISATNLFPDKKKYKIHKSRSSASYCYPSSNIIYLAKVHFRPRIAAATILHELRHFMQYKKFSSEIFIQHKTYWKYYNSPIEKDARSFEKISKEVFAIYEATLALREKIRKMGLDRFKELAYNEEQTNNKTN